MNFVGNVGYVAVAILGGYFAVKGRITVGNIQSFIQYNKQFTQPINQIAQVSSMLQALVAATERIFEFLEEGELDNEYLFQTKNGDIDESRPNGVSLEGYPFTRYIKGRCY